MNDFKELYYGDMHRYGTKKPKGFCQKFSYYLRKSATCKIKLLRYYYKFMYRSLCKKRGIEISWSTNIGKGLYLGHPYNITINPNTILGCNINIHKGVTIGQENRGSRKGVPTIKDNVWIGINAVVVGKITVGEDVLIAPNSYVNCDIPSHSIVIGNPCKIFHQENATEWYVNNKV